MDVHLVLEEDWLRDGRRSSEPAQARENALPTRGVPGAREFRGPALVEMSTRMPWLAKVAPDAPIRTSGVGGDLWSRVVLDTQCGMWNIWLRRCAVDDIFYFAEREVCLSHVASCAEGLGMVAHLRLGALRVVLGKSPYEHCDWAVFELGDAEPGEVQELRQGGIQSGFCVSYHPVACKLLIAILREVLRKYGGWVGSDADEFRPRFNLANLEELALRKGL